jgi:hypothetical protein
MNTFPMSKWGTLEYMKAYRPILENLEQGQYMMLTAQTYDDWNCERPQAVFQIQEARDFAAWIMAHAPDSFVCIEQIDPPTLCRLYDQEGQPIKDASLDRNEEGFLWFYLVDKAYWEANKERLMALEEERAYFDELLGDIRVDL